MSTSPTTNPRRRPPDEVARRIVEFALHAPSVHNTQPWTWRIDDLRLDLYADRARQLAVADPDGRNLMISCGAALHYAVAGAAAYGWAAETELLPQGPRGDHLAVLRLRPKPANLAQIAHAELLAARNTDRRRFINWPIPGALLAEVAARAAHQRASALVVTGSVARLRVELLISRAISVERADLRFAAEQQRWTDSAPEGVADGVPLDNARPEPTDHRQPAWPSRYDEPADAPQIDDRAVGTLNYGLLVVVTQDDDRASWLDAGSALCRLWVAAMEHGLSVVPLSQVVEVPETRDDLRLGVLGDRRRPALVVRVGWQELSRSPLPVTPRRTLEDVLDS